MKGTISKRKRTSLVLPLILVAGLLGSQLFAGSMEDTIKTQAQKCARATVDNDPETLVASTHPKVVQMMGGKEEMIAKLKEGREEMQAEGTAIEAVTVGDP